MKPNLRAISNSSNEYSPPDRDADEMLRFLEAQAWENYGRILQTVTIRTPPGFLYEFFKARILPGFVKLGFGAEFIITLLSLASGAWGALGMTPKHVVDLHPNMRKDLEEVRLGLLIQADKKMAPDSAPTFLTPQASYEILQQSMDPANLHQVIDEITTPWIILPRASNALKRRHAHYLPAYLEMIEQETNEEALHIFTRIAIEFMANFCIRFADDMPNRHRLAQLVMAGYTAMYWKSLHTPPKGFEDVRVFEHFNSWMKYSDCLSKEVKPTLDRILEKMENQKAHIFPCRSEGHRVGSKRPDNARFLVALRHGCLGIASSVRYFAMRPSAAGLPFDKGFAWGALLFDLKSLFDLLADRYGAESQRTQYFIRDFMFQLKNAYEFTLLEGNGQNLQTDPPLKFVWNKIKEMITQLQHTLATANPK